MFSEDSMAYGATATSMPSMSVGGGTYDGKIAGLYDLEETLGSGHFAVVKLARHVFTGAKVAVKVVDKTKLDEVSKAHLFQEVRCMKLVQHPNVVRLYEVIDTQTKLYLVLELGDGGDLYDYIMKHEGGLSEDLARKYFRQILKAITYCHQLHVVHRDLKPENVVFFEKLGIVKLTDFGFSNKFSPGQKLETFCGSLAYSAPEILLGDSYDAPAVDIWSLGVILYMLVCGQPPFEKANDSETLTMIMDCKYTVPPQVTQSCKQLISSMLVRDPKKRATLEQIAAHPWLNDFAEFNANDNLPLVSRQQLSDEDHAFIIQKMINGNIASKEEILQSLDKNKYNHITATYFLLAELRLRKRREEQNPKKHTQMLLPDIISGKSNYSDTRRGTQVPDIKIKPVDSTKVILPINLNVGSPTQQSNDSKNDKRSRKCSIVREEDEEESGYENTNDGNELRVAVTRRESISDGRLNRIAQERANSNVAMQVDVRPKMIVSVDAALVHKLNQIENHAECDTSVNKKKESTLGEKKCVVMEDALKGIKDLEIGKISSLQMGNKNPVLTHRRSKLSKIRTPSCSSSEASDDDTKSRSKKKINKFIGDTPPRFRMHRRDSHDDSSDSQDQSCPPSGSQAPTAHIVAGNNSSGKKDGHKQGKEHKSDDTRKNCSSHTDRHKKPKDDMEKNSRNGVKTESLNSVGRRRVRESQSLDRITEAQEYELRHKSFALDGHTDLRNSLFNLSSYSVAETKEEYDEDVISIGPEKIVKNNLFVADTALHLKRDSICKLNSIEEIDLILEEKSLANAIQITGSKCFVTMKKIRKLGKYFPVVNFS